MLIGSDVHNYMETIVGRLFVELGLNDKYDDDQLQDIACITLSQVRPIYIRFDVDFIAAVSSKQLKHYHHQATIAVYNAEKMIVDDRRQNRDELFAMTLPPVQDDPENRPLEWYEKPILKIK